MFPLLSTRMEELPRRPARRVGGPSDRRGGEEIQAVDGPWGVGDVDGRLSCRRDGIESAELQKRRWRRTRTSSRGASFRGLADPVAREPWLVCWNRSGRSPRPTGEWRPANRQSIRPRVHGSRLPRVRASPARGTGSAPTLRSTGPDWRTPYGGDVSIMALIARWQHPDPAGSAELVIPWPGVAIGPVGRNEQPRRSWRALARWSAVCPSRRRSMLGRSPSRYARLSNECRILVARSDATRR